METSFKNFLFNSWQSKQVFLKLSTVRAKQSPVLREGPQASGLQGRTLLAPQQPNFLQQETLLGGHAMGHSAWPGAALSCESCPPPGRIRQTEGAHHPRALCSGAPRQGSWSSCTQGYRAGSAGSGPLLLSHPAPSFWHEEGECGS